MTAGGLTVTPASEDGVAVTVTVAAAVANGTSVRVGVADSIDEVELPFVSSSRGDITRSRTCIRPLFVLRMTFCQ